MSLLFGFGRTSFGGFGFSSFSGKKSAIIIPTTAVFTPLSLFASGEQGAWYDPSDLSSMNTLSDQTGTVPAVGDPVGYIADKSGNGNHATQATAAKRPTLGQDVNGNYYLDFDGVDDDLIYSGTLLNSATEVSQYNAAQRQVISGTSIYYRMALHNGGLSSGNNYVLDRHNFDGTHGFFVRDGSVTAAASVGTSANFTSYITGQIAASGSQQYRVNGVLEGSGTVTLSSLTTNVLALGSSGTGVNFWTGVYFGGLVIDRVITAQEITDTESYLAAKSGVTL